MLKAQIYTDPNAPALALLIAFVSKYEADALLWDSQIIRNEIERDYAITLDDMQADKLNAAIEVLTSNAYKTNWNVFETCSHLLANVPVDSTVVSPLSVEEIVKSIAEAYLIRHEPLEFSSDVNVYAGTIFYEFGMSSAPEIFASAILPKCNKTDDKEKNKALKELFDYHVKFVVDYVEKMET